MKSFLSTSSTPLWVCSEATQLFQSLPWWTKSCNLSSAQPSCDCKPCITAASSAVNHSKETGSGDKSLGFPYLQEALLAPLVLQLQDLLYCPEMDTKEQKLFMFLFSTNRQQSTIEEAFQSTWKSPRMRYSNTKEGLVCTRREQLQLWKSTEFFYPLQLLYLQRSYLAFISSEPNSPFLLLVLLVPKPPLVLEYPAVVGRKTHQDAFIP